MPPLIKLMINTSGLFIVNRIVVGFILNTFQAVFRLPPNTISNTIASINSFEKGLQNYFDYFLYLKRCLKRSKG